MQEREALFLEHWIALPAADLRSFIGSSPLTYAMAKSQSESSDDFEFIETPAAPTPQPPAEDCGVRTTSVGRAGYNVG